MANFKLGPSVTHVSLINLLKVREPVANNKAWSDFRSKYGPIISGYARRYGANRDMAEEIVQEVTLGVFRSMPKFEYDPQKGRFRGYLKKCASSALRHWRRKNPRYADVHIADPAGPDGEKVWNDTYDEELLRQVMGHVKKEFKADHTYAAFEMVVLLEMSPQEVAVKLGISRDSVYTAKRRVSVAIRTWLEEMKAL